MKMSRQARMVGALTGFGGWLAGLFLLDGVDAGAVHAQLTPHSPGLTTLVAPLEPGSAESVPETLVGHILAMLGAMALLLGSLSRYRESSNTN